MIMSLFLVMPGSALAVDKEAVKAEPMPVEKTSCYYRFEGFALTSLDQQRHYQIVISIPKAPIPEQGYPVLYMLDGNAALAALNEQDFSRLKGGDWPVIVTLGYQHNAQPARAYDYTPTAKSAQYGGAEAFWQFVEQEVKPRVAKRIQLDAGRQSLWGHSFGGLFVLHTLFNHPESFQSYIAVDPSLWWQQGQILNDEASYKQRKQRPNGHVLIQRSASHREGSTLPEDATRRLAKRLSQLPELTVQYYDYFQHHHGSVRAASIPSALRMAQGIEQQ
ncbi:hypothetical protein GCM10011502_09920 [Oceanisphaera marina]|uniref:Esterase n=1 Tax=Oceanisphaera marina TaxID=2017550 RepID=A0ABQ1IG70_9GAMM|nr:hypothetical protein GCM10011502_09920 [Oceanisphaera marina]